MIRTAISLFVLAIFAAGCTPIQTGNTNKTNSWDTVDGKVLTFTLTQISADFNLTLERLEYWGDRLLHDGKGNRILFRKDRPEVYWFNSKERGVEYPNVRYVEGDLVVPQGVYNDLALDLGYPEKMIKGSGPNVDRPYKDKLRHDVPEVKEAEKAQKVKQPTNGVLKGFTITIDPGHGGKDPGAIAVNNTYEKTVALSISLKVKASLEALGAKIVMTRADDTYKTLDQRVEIANAAKSDFFISIHANAVANDKPAGVETWYRSEGNRGVKSQALADAVQGAVIANTGAKNRKLVDDYRGLRVLRKTNMPAILLEAGFLSNRDEAGQLSSDSYRTKIANGVVKGVLEYVQGNVSASLRR